MTTHSPDEQWHDVEALRRLVRELQGAAHDLREPMARLARLLELDPPAPPQTPPVVPGDG